MFQSARHLANGSETWHRAWEQCQRKPTRKELRGEAERDRESIEKNGGMKRGGRESGDMRDRERERPGWDGVGRSWGVQEGGGSREEPTWKAEVYKGGQWQLGQKGRTVEKGSLVSAAMT